MSEVTVQMQVTQTLAEAYNMLAAADLNVTGGELAKAGATMVSFQSVIQALSEGQLVVTEAEQPEPQKPGLARIEGGDVDETE